MRLCFAASLVASAFATEPITAPDIFSGRKLATAEEKAAEEYPVEKCKAAAERYGTSGGNCVTQANWWAEYDFQGREADRWCDKKVVDFSSVIESFKAVKTCEDMKESYLVLCNTLETCGSGGGMTIIIVVVAVVVVLLVAVVGFVLWKKKKAKVVSAIQAPDAA